MLPDRNPSRKKRGEDPQVTFRLPKQKLERLDERVREGDEYDHRSELIREAVDLVLEECRS